MIKHVARLFVAPLILGLAGLCQAQSPSWPEKTVTLVVPFPAGGSTDSVARSLAPKLSDRFGKTVIVDNKPGATGTIGATAVKRAPADGYTLLVTSLGPLVIAPHLIKGVQYDALSDFDTITIAVQAPNVLVVPANSPHNKLADVIAYQKANPGKMSFASSGNGSSDHLTAALFWQQTGTSGLHVPYKGGSPAVTDLLGGQVDASFQNINAVLPHIKAGKLKALVITSEKRSPLLPDVPTFAEAGVKNAEVYSWQAIVAPRGLPPAVRAQLHTAIVASLNDAALKAQFTSLGFEIIGNTPEQFAAYQAKEYARWKTVIETGKIAAD
jgi:tripartite-type tricarboxylate transporter receptor subunit TctC